MNRNTSFFWLTDETSLRNFDDDDYSDASSGLLIEDESSDTEGSSLLLVTAAGGVPPPPPPPLLQQHQDEEAQPLVSTESVTIGATLYYGTTTPRTSNGKSTVVTTQSCSPERRPLLSSHETSPSVNETPDTKLHKRTSSQISNLRFQVV